MNINYDDDYDDSQLEGTGILTVPIHFSGSQTTNQF